MKQIVQENEKQKKQDGLLAKMIDETFDWSRDHPLEFYEKVPKVLKPYEKPEVWNPVAKHG